MSRLRSDGQAEHRCDARCYEARIAHHAQIDEENRAVEGGVQLVRAIATATVVLPTPPDPTIVTNRSALSRSDSFSRSSSRSIMAPSRPGRL